MATKSSHSGSTGSERGTEAHVRKARIHFANKLAEGSQSNSLQIPFSSSTLSDASLIQPIQSSQGEQIDASLHNDHNSIVAYSNGVYIGRVYLDDHSDRQDIQDPFSNTLHVSAVLVIEPHQAARMPDVYQAAQSFVGGPVILQTSSQTNNGKRQRPLSDTTPAAKRAKVATPGSPSVRSPSPSEYSRAIEEPTGLTKEESGSCITCIRGKRKCKGTQIQLIKGHKRCETCATPGTNTSGRVCYWKNKDRGVFTYKDAQREMAKELGGRVLTANTRAGRLERQQRKTSASTGATSSMPDDVSHLIDPDLYSDTICGDEDAEADAVVHADTDDAIHEELNGELASAVDSAYRSLYDIIANDLDVSNNEGSCATSLLVDRAILEALNGGVHHDRAKGIDDEVLSHMRSRVQVYIRTYEAILDMSKANSDQDEQ